MPTMPSVSSLALKEWAVTVNALTKGRQIMTVRKGGIHRDDKEFRVVHPQFLLYPSYEHQKAELLKADYDRDLLETLQEGDDTGTVTLSCWSQVTDVFELRDEETLERLSEFHVWTNDYAQKRLHWRPKHPLTVVLLRVYRLQQSQALPVTEEYLGCKSWVDLDLEVPLDSLAPVLTDEEYETKADAIRQTVGEGALATR